MNTRIRFYVLQLIFLAGIFISCEESEDILLPSELQGTYIGTFERTSPTGKFKQANVEITFEGNAFEGSSNERNYPAICNGTFNVEGDKITFQNACIFTADFDWRLILNNEFSIRYEGEDVILHRRYDDEVEDTYRLRKEIN